MKKLTAFVLALLVTVSAHAALPASDTFTGGAAALETHTSDSGHSWGATATNFDIDGSGNLVATGQHAVDLVASPASADYYVEVVARTGGATSNDRFGVYCRYDGADVAADDGYLAWITGADGWQLFDIAAGTPTQLAAGTVTDTVGSFAASTDYTLRLTCEGTTITASINGMTAVENSGTNPATDATHASALNPGFYGRNSNALTTSFDAQAIGGASGLLLRRRRN